MNFMLSVSVVLPLCIYIAFGALAARMKLIDERTANKMNGFAFRTLFPLMMFKNTLSAAEALESGDITLPFFVSALVLVFFALLMLIVPVFIKSRPRQASFIQGCFRANSVLFAMPVVEVLCGEENVGLAAMCVAVVVPLYNVLAVIVLEVKRGGKVNLGSILKGIITNPIILGAAAGIIMILLKVRLPDLIMTPLKTLANMVTPLALILLGSTLKVSGIVEDAGALIAACVVKLVLAPALFMGAAWLAGYRDVALISVFALTCVPAAVSSYTMAQQMGADGKLAGEIVAVTTIMSMLTVFLWVLGLSGVGII